MLHATAVTEMANANTQTTTAAADTSSTLLRQQSFLTATLSHNNPLSICQPCLLGVAEALSAAAALSVAEALSVAAALSVAVHLLM